MTLRLSASLLGALLGALLSTAPVARAQPRYAVTGLGNLGLDAATVAGLSEDGQVLGFAFNMVGGRPDYATQAPFVHRLGSTTALPSPAGLPIWPTDINSAGQIVGSTYVLDPTFQVPVYQRAVQMTGGTALDLGTLGGTRARAEAINESGQITGSSRVPGSSLTHAFLYSNGVMTDLGAPTDGRSSGAAINAHGVVAGSITPADSFEMHAAIFDHGQITELAGLGGTSAARGLNDAEQAVGYAELPDATQHAMLWTAGQALDLGAFAGRQYTYASDINNPGQIVGIAFNDDEWDNQVFLRTGGQMLDLNALLDPVRSAGWTITGAYAINDRGQIAGDGILDGARQAVLLTPVPEPATWLLWAAGMPVLARLTRHGNGRARRAQPASSLFTRAT